jgi:hypothetical protein
MRDDITTDAEGIQYFNQGKSQHSHLIRLTLKDRVEITESVIKNLEERIALLENKTIQK